jgi:glutathione S-transferase
VSPLLAHHDRPPFSGRPSLTGHCGHGWTRSLTRSVAHDLGFYPAVNNGVYRAGFATSQTAYEEAYRDLFTMLDRLESRLGERSSLLGEQITEADWRLFTTLIRFDAVYYGHFKCNRDRLMEVVLSGDGNFNARGHDDNWILPTVALAPCNFNFEWIGSVSRD